MIGWFLGTRLGRWMTLIGAFLALLVGAIFFGWTRRGQAEADKALKSYQKTGKRIRNADDFGGDPDLARRWLREHGKSRSDL